MTRLSFKTGQTILVGIANDDGDSSNVSSVTASLRRQGRTQVLAMSATPRAATDSVPEGWNLTLLEGAADPGMYELDARVRVGGADIVTDTLMIEIVRAVTPRAP